MVSSLFLRFKKGADGRIASFALHRSDGSFTVQRNPNGFFPAHDLTHYVVETTLGFRRAFYGLVCEGWDFADFGTPWPRGPMPGDEAGPAEFIVGFLDIERNTGYMSNAAALMERLRSIGCDLVITDEQLDRIRQFRDALIARWQQLPPGKTLELEFMPERLAPHS
jgi:hypothetical protein